VDQALVLPSSIYDGCKSGSLNCTVR